MGPDWHDIVRLRDILDLARTMLDRLNSYPAQDGTSVRPELARRSGEAVSSNYGENLANQVHPGGIRR